MATNLIKIQKEEIKPRVVCGHCKNEILIDIVPFSNDCSKIMQDRCPECKKELFVALLILSQIDLNRLLKTVELITTTLGNASKIIGGVRQ